MMYACQPLSSRYHYRNPDLYDCLLCHPEATFQVYADAFSLCLVLRKINSLRQKKLLVQIYPLLDNGAVNILHAYACVHVCGVYVYVYVRVCVYAHVYVNS